MRKKQLIRYGEDKKNKAAFNDSPKRFILE